MGDYPDPDEEYELMYADDLELLRENDDDTEPNVVSKKPMPAKRSLDFSSPVPKKPQIPPAVVNAPLSVSQISLTPLQPVEEILTPTTGSNKRTADDLFGDIDDIDFDAVELPSKRQKTEEENDLDLINKILESRKLKQMLLEPSRAQREVQPVFNTKDNLSLSIPRWAFMPITNADGDRIYVKLESEDSWDQSLETSTNHRSLHSLYTKTWEEAKQILEKKQEDALIRESQEPLPDIAVDINSNNLWVEKYKPQSYLDLLSEEPVNRALLHWLHLWDKVVFKKEVKTSEPQQRNSFSKRTGQFQMSNKWRGKREAEPEVDDDGRPHHKVALLCGPPGVGKTTLAHLLAKIAGYRPVELNASDERSTEAFRTALQNATLMRSVLDKDRRPNCLILDEIDGAPLPTVELLVKWCVAAPDAKKKTKPQPLRRPVIAICNDLYATSLRPLRTVALVIHVGGVTPARLSSRLARVAAREGVRAPPHVLTALAARANGDVRTAIQVLSFTRARDRTQLRLEDVENASIGTKDCNKSLMQALIALFTTNDKETDIVKTIQSAGEYDRLIDGVFENYLSARVDARLHIACETLSWLRLYDLVYSWTLRGQNYSLYGLLPLCIARCHTLLASRTPQRVKFPMQAQEVYRKKTEIESIATSVWRGSTPSVLLPRAPLRLELLPLLPHLLNPALRSANVQLCSESECKALRTCAGAMCDYGLQYAQQRTQDGLYAFVMEPDIYKVAFMGNEERMRPPPAVRQAIAREQQLEMIRRSEEMANRANKNRPATSTQIKSKEAKSVTAVKESRLPNHLQRLKPKEVEKVTPQISESQTCSQSVINFILDSDDPLLTTPMELDNTQKEATDTQRETEEVQRESHSIDSPDSSVHKDFFGRIVPLSQMQRSDAVPDVISSSSVFYQYQEGFNNAVRRNVRVRDLL